MRGAAWGVRPGPEVYLNVYDLAHVGMCLDLSETLKSRRPRGDGSRPSRPSRARGSLETSRRAGLNKRLMGTWEVGLFHAGVEICGVEYSRRPRGDVGSRRGGAALASTAAPRAVLGSIGGVASSFS